MLQLLNFVERIEKFFISLLILASVGISCAGVFFRYGMNNSLPFVEELAGYILLAVVLLGSSLAVRSRDHIRVELLQQMFPKLNRPANILAWATVLTVSLVMAWLASRFALRVIGQGQTSNTLTGLQIGYPLLSLPIGFALCAFKSVFALIDEITGQYDFSVRTVAEEEMADVMPTEPSATGAR